MPSDWWRARFLREQPCLALSCRLHLLSHQNLEARTCTVHTLPISSNDSQLLNKQASTVLTVAIMDPFSAEGGKPIHQSPPFNSQLILTLISQNSSTFTMASTKAITPRSSPSTPHPYPLQISFPPASSNSAPKLPPETPKLFSQVKIWEIHPTTLP